MAMTMRPALDYTWPIPPPAHRTPPVMADPGLPHQIVIAMTTPGQVICVSCNCLGTHNANGTITYQPLDARTRWEPGEAAAAWRAHMTQVTP